MTITGDDFPHWWSSPAPPTVDEVVELARAYYAHPDNGAGGSFHIVLDDGNLEDEDVHWCQGYAAGANDRPHGWVLGVALGRLTFEQREAVYARYDEYRS